ncbi:sensor domain-containing diguanylate cyclase [Vibrio brasiliensis]|uniref:diguanylate cyclase n=1 Tax=Vibrio brasiliensis LMG 20546 TaxID=945543 RepID=E8LYP1_9VIBR|nr:GGDEF domain-containing protein [Vibrio brasiliensis]EGA64192.1 diguanylate cyclase [Vibrio brasiliensis LMG 20546]
MGQRLKLLIIIVVSSVVFVMTTYAISKQVLDKVIGGLLWEYAQVSAQNDAQVLKPIAVQSDLIKQLANHPNITSWAQNSDDSVYQAVAEDTLEHFRWRLDSKNFFIALDQNLAYHYNDVNSIRQLSFFRHYLDPDAVIDKWFFEQKENGVELSVNIAHDVHLNLTRIWLNQTIEKDGQFLGIVGTGIDVTSLFEQFSDYHPSGIETFFIDEQMRIQLVLSADSTHYPLRDSRSRKPLLSSVISNHSDYLALEKLMKLQKKGQEAQVLMVEQASGQSAVAIHYIESLGWYEVTFVSVDTMVPGWVTSQLYFPLLAITLLFATILFGWLVKHWLIPLEHWTERLAQLTKEPPANQPLTAKCIDHCFNELENELHHSRKGLDHLVASRTAALDQLATFDVLTQLHNKRGLEKELSAELARSSREQHQFGLLWIDAGITPLSDSEQAQRDYQSALQLVAKGLQRAIREYDVAARWAEDEFLVLVRCEQTPTLERIANRIKQYVDAHQDVARQDFRHPIKLSIGGALIEPQMSLQQALALADSSLYLAQSKQTTIYIHPDSRQRKRA